MVFGKNLIAIVLVLVVFPVNVTKNCEYLSRNSFKSPQITGTQINVYQFVSFSNLKLVHF